MYGETKKDYETKKKSFVTLIPAKVQAAASKLTCEIRYLQQQYPKSPSPTLHTFLTHGEKITKNKNYGTGLRG